MDHSYTNSKKNQGERIPSFMEHSYYSNINVTPKNKRKRDASWPTGKTPTQDAKCFQLNDGKRQVCWSPEEKDFLRTYVKESRQERGSTFWATCAEALNAKFCGQNRNGESCRRMSQRLTLCSSKNGDNLAKPTYPPDGNMEGVSPMATTNIDAQTQTDLSLPPDNTGLTDIHHAADWVFIEPKKDLKDTARKGAQMVHDEALKRLRTFPDLKPSERAALIDLLCSGSAKHIARAIMTSTLFEHVKTLILFDIEMDARECTNLGSILYSNQFKNLSDFSWENVLDELLTKQTFLAEALLAASLPTAKIGNYVF